MRHNEIRDTTATLLTEVCSNVYVEPHLQPLSNEDLNGTSTLRDDGARLHIAVDGFGVLAERGHILLSGYLTLLLCLIDVSLYPQCIELRRTIRKDNIARESEKWNALHLHH